MSRHKHRGYVLIVVLVLLQIVSCLGIYELLSVSKHLRINRDRWLRLEYRESSEQLLKQLEVSLLQGMVTCQIPRLAANELTAKPLSWWRLHACVNHHATFEHYYVIEPLEVDECAAMTENNTNHSIIAQYYRITVYANMSEMKYILQTTLAIPHQEHLVCAGSAHVVIPGRQMFRELVEPGE